MGVPGYPSYAFSGGLMFVKVHGCSLMAVGVPVKLHQMTRWEDLNSRPLVCRCLLLLSARFNCALVACAGVLFFT
ncbi:MAG: hypothetical protein ACJ8BW_37980 [Ktedonobacteraceae bacterium]